MGARLVAEVMARWTSVPHNAFRVLVQMALTALDAPTSNSPSGLYFAGLQPLMDALAPGGPKQTYEARERSAQRALADLVEMGAIERTNKARAGSRQVYRLTLNSAVRELEKKPNQRWSIDEPPVDNSGQGDTSCHPQHDTMRHPEGDTSCRGRVTTGVTPRNHEEGLQEKRKEETDLRGPVTLPRASPPNEDGFIPPTQCGYPGCVRGWIVPADPLAPNEPCPRCNPNVVPFRRPA